MLSISKRLAGAAIGKFLLTCALGVLCLTTAAHAALLGVGGQLQFPLVFFDSGGPQTGITSYDATQQILTVASTPQAILVPPPAPMSRDSNNRQFIRLRAKINNAGILQNDPGNTFEMYGHVTINGTVYDGLLVSGTVSAFGSQGIQSSPDGTTARFDFAVQVTGGLIQSMFAPTLGVDVTSSASNFDGMFSANSTGGAQGSIGKLAAANCTGLAANAACALRGSGASDFATAFAGPGCDLDTQPGVGCKAGFIGKLKTITLRYTGGTCAGSANSQGNKATCSGSVNPAQAVTVVAGNSSLSTRYTVSPATVAPGESFTITGPFQSSSLIRLSNSGGTINYGIDTSCSQPLVSGDKFGGLQVIAIGDDTGYNATFGAQVDYFCKVANNGSAAFNNVNLQDMPTPSSAANICSAATIPSLPPGQSREFTGTRFVTARVSDIITASGTPSGGFNVCTAQGFVASDVRAKANSCPSGTSTVKGDFNSTAIPGGSTVWFSSVVKASGIPSSVGTLQCKNPTLRFSSGGTQFALSADPAKITFSPNASMAVTVHDEVNSEWDTVVPHSYSGNVFLTGVAFRVPLAGLPGGIKGVQWTCEFAASNNGMSVSWQWGAAVYSNSFGNEPDFNVKPIDGNKINPYLNGDKAGTPEAYKANLIKGARGNGGSEYTGSLTSATNVTPCGPGNIPGAFACDSHIRQVKMVWNGAVPVNVRAYADLTGTQLVQTINNVQPGQVITVGDYSSSQNDVLWKLSDPSNNASLGSSQFNLSCSDPEMSGPDDCGRSEGNGKKNKAGFVNDWVLSGFTTVKGNSLVCQ